jgi:uncharacterized LabA/DUF88 family protein
MNEARRATSRRIRRAAILVDWRNLFRLTGIERQGVPAERYIRRSIFAVQEQCARLIGSFNGEARYQCRVRVYDGWHANREAMPDRLVFERLYQSGRAADFSRTIGRVSFPDVPEFGDRLVHDERYGTLYHTRRPQGQKMVDTSIIADALALIVTNYADVVVIVSDDDDFVPALVTGEALEYHVCLLRAPGRTLEAITDFRSSLGVRFWS